MVRKTNDFSKEELIVFKNLYLSKNYKCGVSLEKINTICVKLLQLGYNKEQVFKMVSRNLKIFTINSCNIDKKIQFLRIFDHIISIFYYSLELSHKYFLN